MPYIKDEERRANLRNEDPALNAGELNYQIFFYALCNSRLPFNVIENYDKINKFVTQFLGEKPNYQRYNDATGALIRCEREIKRRFYRFSGFSRIWSECLLNVLDNYDNEIGNYEDLKIIENGDV
jgi:hypothetical protein